MHHIRDAIKKRRSIRKFTDEPVDENAISEIIIAGSWAPSGLNNQPWRFATVVKRDAIDQMAGLTRYGHILKNCPAAIVVFIDREAMYNDLKDHQAIGACIQNMLLAAGELGLGSVWLGEILNQAKQVNRVLDIPTRYLLMAVVALGHPVGTDQIPERKNINELIIKKL